MNKAVQADFDFATPVKEEKPKTKAQKLAEFRDKNEAPYRAACSAQCTCTPSRADLLLMDQWEGRAPIE